MTDYLCEGDLDCPNKVELDIKEAGQMIRNDNAILCADCKPRYGHLTSSQIIELQENDL